MWSKVAVAITAMSGLMVTGGAEAGIWVGARIHIRPGVVRPAPVVVRHAPVAPALRFRLAGPVFVGPGLGELAVQVEPDRARVYVDGSFVGHGDTTKVLGAGTHTVRVVLADGREVRESVHVMTGRQTRVTLEL